MYLRVNATADKAPRISCSIMPLFKDIIFRSWTISYCQNIAENQEHTTHNLRHIHIRTRGV